jgi:transposase
MQKALTEMNLQLHRVISDITATTGMAIIRAIVAGERDPEVLASNRDGRIKASCTEIAAALTGDYRPELVFILQQELQLYDFFQTQISACDTQIEQCLASFDPKVDVNAKPLAKPKRCGKKQPGNAPQFDLRCELYRISGVDFTQIDGLGAVTVLTLISELGLDPSRFPTVKHFTSWLGLCPGSRITGGKAKSSKSRRVVNRVATALRTAAQSLCRSRSALGGFYRRLATRLGAPKAITATAHKLARIFYRLWTSGDHYTDPGIDAYEQQYQERMLKNLKKKAQALGLQLIPISTPTECVS